MTKHLSDLHHVDELKNFAANNLFRLVIEVAYWDPPNWLVTYLGAVHQKGELSLLAYKVIGIPCLLVRYLGFFACNRLL